MLNAIFPILSAVDGLFAAVLPAVGRVLLWGAIAGALAMSIYRLTSNQSAIARLKAQARDLRRRMLEPELEQPEVGRLVRANLKASFGLLGKTLLPAILSTAPVLLVAVWLDAFYGYVVPPGGAPVRLHIEPPGAAVAIEPADRMASVEDAELAVIPPPAGEALTIEVAGITAFAGNPFVPPTPVLTQRQWWNAWLGNPVGYVNPQAGIDEIALDLPRRRLFGGVPDWMAGWEIPYFLSIFVAALALKLGLRIE